MGRQSFVLGLQSPAGVARILEVAVQGRQTRGLGVLAALGHTAPVEVQRVQEADRKDFAAVHVRAVRRVALVVPDRKERVVLAAADHTVLRAALAELDRTARRLGHRVALAAVDHMALRQVVGQRVALAELDRTAHRPVVAAHTVALAEVDRTALRLAADHNLVVADHKTALVVLVDQMERPPVLARLAELPDLAVRPNQAGLVLPKRPPVLADHCLDRRGDFRWGDHQIDCSCSLLRCCDQRGSAGV